MDASPENELVVVLDHDADLAALPAATSTTLSPAMQDYLCSQGVTDPRTWAAFRLDQVTDADLGRMLTPLQRRHIRPTGIWLPTFHPAKPTAIAGLVRLSQVQHIHRFITPPTGLAAPADLDRQRRIVLIDNPLIAMRLHQYGVAGVAIVEDPLVLPPLTAWLAEREVVLVSTRPSCLAALRLALGSVASTSMLAAGDPTRQASLIRDLGGQPPVVAPLPITSPVVRDLLSYAQGRLDAGEAQAALALFGATTPELVRGYHIGYLPSEYRSALSKEARSMLLGRRCGDSLVLPAYDDTRRIVDLHILRANPASTTVENLGSEPQGLLAPEIAAGHATILVTDNFWWLARLFAQGYHNVLLLRGPTDAQQNAGRLVSLGVQNVVLRSRRHVEAMASALQVVGLRVTIDRNPVDEPLVVTPTDAPTPQPTPEPEAPAAVQPAALPPSPLPTPSPVQPAVLAPVDPTVPVFVEVERDGEVAIYQAGPVRYAITLREDGLTQRRVVIRAHGKSCNHDLDLAVPAQRERTASSVAKQVGLPAATVVAHLIALLAAVREREEAAAQIPAVAVSDTDRVGAEAFLAAPDLLDRIAADLTALGWVGEASTKQLLYLTGISRLLPQPVWAVYQASAGAAPWQGLGCIAALTPPEARLVFHRVTDAALTQADRASLQHRLLIVDQAETLRPEAALALRVLHERGGVGWASAETSAAPALLSDWRGPVSVLAAAVGHLDHRCRDCFLSVTVDESPEQTARILADQRHRLGAPVITAATHAAIIARHHAAQRLLARMPVVIPFVDRIAFPSSRVRHRNEQAWLLGLIATSALLHQRQRLRDGDAVVASEADFAHAVRCTAGLLGRTGDGISGAARRLLDVLTARHLDSFTMADVGSFFPDWSSFAYRAALQDLLDFGYLESPRGGRGRRRHYTLMQRTATALQAGDIHLLPVGHEPTATQFAAVRAADTANFTPVRTGT